MLSALILILAAATQTADPMAPALAGQIQCFTPNVAAKTCQAIAKYTRNGDGSWTGVSTLLLAPAPVVTMTSSSSATLTNGALCGIIKREDFANATVAVGGVPLPAEQASTITGQVLAAVTPMIGQNACTSWKPEGNVLVAETTLNGTARPELTQRFIWVNAADGYTVAP